VGGTQSEPTGAEGPYRQVPVSLWDAIMHSANADTKDESGQTTDLTTRLLTAIERRSHFKLIRPHSNFSELVFDNLTTSKSTNLPILPCGRLTADLLGDL